MPPTSADLKKGMVERTPDYYAVIALDADLNANCIGLWVGAAGSIDVEFWHMQGTDIVLVGVPAGTYIKGRFKQINAAGTTVAAPATNIHQAIAID